jgi:flagellar FliL protein
MNKKIIIAVVAVLLIGGYEGYSMATAKAPPKQRIGGEIYILPKQFTLNLADNRYATLTVALELAAGQSDGSGAGEAAATPPDGFGTLPEEAAIRDIVTNIVTGDTSTELITPPGRTRVKNEILKAILARTDVKITDVLFTDVAVQ